MNKELFSLLFFIFSAMAIAFMFADLMFDVFEYKYSFCVCLAGSALCLAIHMYLSNKNL